ncbi:hypothetical protein CLOM_g20157 [Closterium sp. NIES-68]|nr:hypothetical protein CLOM_g20157 [Closterium sp. NIES-68]GJP77174.1 hypothetical protein CLOP_g7603 [Closterium sp. NIES-67]
MQPHTPCPSLRCSRLTSTGVTVAALGGACCWSSLMGVFSSMVNEVCAAAVHPCSSCLKGWSSSRLPTEAVLRHDCHTTNTW